MNSSEKIQRRKIQDHKNQLRRENRAQVQQALLISEYIQCKYTDVYQEAANFYNELNARYPSKSDLRRTDEFKVLKMGIPFHTKKVTRKYTKQSYEPIQVTTGSSFTLICQQLASTEGDEQPTANPEKYPEGDEQTAANPEGDEQTAANLEGHEQTAANPEKYPEGDEQTAANPEGDEQTAANPEGDEQTAANPEKHPEGDGQKIMQLRIPLLKPSVITQTVQVVTDEVLEENPLQVASNEIVPESTTLYPSLHEEIPNDILERIINELRQEPELNTIMTDIEQSIELEQLDMDIDIPIDDRLENELENLFW